MKDFPTMDDYVPGSSSESESDNEPEPNSNVANFFAEAYPESQKETRPLKRKTDDVDFEADELREKIKKRKTLMQEETQEEEKKKDLIDFHELGISRSLIKVLNEMEIDQPTDIQKATIPVALEGKDIYGCAATGTGKTLAFMLPVLERLLYKPLAQPATRVLVLTPTRELALQVHEVVEKLKKYCGRIFSTVLAGGLNINEQAALLRKIPDIVVATPGRLLDHINSTLSFSLQDIEILILDEADRMLDEEFIEQVKEVLNHCYPHHQTMLFSATMTEKVDELADVTLKNPVKVFVNDEDQVAINLFQEFIKIKPAMEQKKEAILATLLSRSFPKRTAVFFNTKNELRRVGEILRILEFSVGDLHGDMKQPKRIIALRQFKNGTFDILLTTDVAARGIDIKNLETVINYSMPKELKSYVHRVGRTARAGKIGRAVSLVQESERKILKNIMKKSTHPLKQRVVNKVAVSFYHQKISEVASLVEERLKDSRLRDAMDKASHELTKAEELLNTKPKERAQQMENHIKRNVSILSNRTKRQKKREMARQAKKEVPMNGGVKEAKRKQRDDEAKGLVPQKTVCSKKKKKPKKKDFSDKLTCTDKKDIKKLKHESKAPRIPGNKLSRGKKKHN